jgi:hypothetical protein
MPSNMAVRLLRESSIDPDRKLRSRLGDCPAEIFDRRPRTGRGDGPVRETGSPPCVLECGSD